MHEFRSIVAAAMMSAAGAVIFLILPMLVGLFVDYRGFTEQQAGVLSSIFFAAYFLTGASAFLWIEHADLRRIGWIAYGLMVAGLAFTAAVKSPLAMATTLGLSGAGSGALFALGVAVIAQTRNQDRNFGWVLFAQQLSAATLLFLIPSWVVPHWGLSGGLLAIALAVGVMSMSLKLLPELASVARSEGREHGARDLGSGGARWALVVMVLHFAALSALWTFVERIGAGSGLATSEIGNALALSMLGGLAGAVTVTVLGDRLGRQLPLWLAAIAFLLVAWGYSQPLVWLEFAALAALLSFAWNFVLAYQMGIVTGLDVDGRYSVLIPAAQAGGAMTGPVLGGWLLTVGGYALLLVAVPVGILMATAVFSRLAHSITT